MMKTEKKDIYKMITDLFLEKLEQGVIPWEKPWKGGGAPKNMISKKNYNGINVLLLSMQPYETNLWLSYKQAQEKGGQVRKGEKGTPVVFWKMLEKENSKGAKETIPLLRYSTVFNVSQCDGIEYEKPEIDETIQPIEKCLDLVQAMPSKPEITHNEPAAYYRPDSDTVNMPAIGLFKGAAEYHSTLFHELVHSTGHEKRLGRHKTDKCSHMFGSNDYSKEELVAEIGASFLCGICGIENRTIDNSAAYIQSWIKRFKEKPKLLVEASAKAQKAVDYITGSTN